MLRAHAEKCRNVRPDPRLIAACVMGWAATTNYTNHAALLPVLMAEQNFNQATKIADRGYIIVHGKIEFEGKSTRELRENELVKKYYLGG